MSAPRPPGWLGIPVWVWLLAALVGLGRMIPFALAELRTPEGWTFTGNISASPDYMQYRTWSRQAVVEGPIVSNRFTAEPNRPYLPVPAYWVTGQLAQVTGITPEWVNAWLGLPLAIALVLLLFLLVRRHVPPGAPTRWTLGALLLGGGLGGLMVIVRRTAALREFHPLYVTVIEPMSGPNRVAPFEDFRGNYIVQSLLDTHFLTYWVATLAAVLVLLAVVREPTSRRLVLLAATYAAATALHVYEGITLGAIAAGVLLMAWRRGLPARSAMAILFAAGAGAGAVLLAVAALQGGSGLPAPTWRGLVVPVGIVLLAYPVAWLLIGRGGLRYWLEADRERAVLVGWSLGCLALLLSGPFFPYPDRGSMTLQVPLMLIAAGIYFRERRRVSRAHAALLVALCGLTPLLMAEHQLTRRFRPDWAHSWLSPAHLRVLDAVRQADADDLLLADEVSLRWIGPEYRGRHFAGHFFLTVRHAEKQAALEAFLGSDDAAAQREFLDASGATLLFVPADRDPDRFAAVTGVTPLVAESVGVLFRVEPGAVGTVTDAADDHGD